MSASERLRSSVSPKFTEAELEQAASTLLGKLLFLFSRLETNLALYLVADKNNTLPELEEKSFKEKLDLLIPTVSRAYGADPRCMKAWSSWVQEANTVRIQRNNLVHGRWAIDSRRQQVVNVTGRPGSRSEFQSETRYSIKELEHLVLVAERSTADFSTLRREWPM